MLPELAPHPQFSRRTVLALQVGPVVLLALDVALAALPPTRELARWFFYTENGPVELATWVFAMMGGYAALQLAARGRRLGIGKLAVAFYAAFGVGLLLTGMDEIAWGQWFFHWSTPEFWRSMNAQHETTFHNIQAVQESTEVFRIVYAAGGLIGIACWRVPALARMATPRVLGPVMALVLVHAIADWALDFIAPGTLLEKGATRTSELMELYVTASAWLYAVLNAQRLEPAVGGSFALPANAAAMVAIPVPADDVDPAAGTGA